MKSLLLVAALIGLSCTLGRGEDAKSIYQRECAKCHGADGKGDTKMGRNSGAKDYTDPRVQAAMKDEKAFRSIKDGLTEGDKILMKPAADLSNGQIRKLVVYMRGFIKG